MKRSGLSVATDGQMPSLSGNLQRMKGKWLWLTQLWCPSWPLSSNTVESKGLGTGGGFASVSQLFLFRGAARQTAGCHSRLVLSQLHFKQKVTCLTRCVLLNTAEWLGLTLSWSQNHGSCPSLVVIAMLNHWGAGNQASSSVFTLQFSESE